MYGKNTIITAGGNEIANVIAISPHQINLGEFPHFEYCDIKVDDFSHTPRISGGCCLDELPGSSGTLGAEGDACSI